MTIRTQLETRASTRAASRKAADKIVELILKELDNVPEPLQYQVVGMVLSELQIATRKEEVK